MAHSAGAGWGRWLARAATVAYGAAVAYMSLRRFGESEIERAIDRIGRGYFHLPAYAALAVLLILSTNSRRSRARRAVAAFAVATAYGWLLEVAQIPAPTRSFNALGLAFDAAGAAAGAIAGLAFLVWTSRRGKAEAGPTLP